MEPTIIHKNGDLEYIASEGKLLLQLDTGMKYTRAYERADDKHHRYEEIDA